MGLESRMREIRLSGSEGGGVLHRALPTPISELTHYESHGAPLERMAPRLPARSHGRGFPWGVVARAGADEEPCVAIGPQRFHAHGAASAVFSGVGRVVCQGVLVADIVGDLHTGGFPVVQGPREVVLAAGEFGELL